MCFATLTEKSKNYVHTHETSKLIEPVAQLLKLIQALNLSSQDFLAQVKLYSFKGQLLVGNLNSCISPIDLNKATCIVTNHDKTSVGKMDDSA